MNEAATPSISTYLSPATSKKIIDEFLQPIIAQRIASAHVIEPSYAALWKSIEHLLNAGGKRFRSYMTLLLFEAYSTKPIETILPVAAAQELLHLAMLIHDDIIDRDMIRYGIKNVTATYLDHYQSLIHDEGDRHHYAQSAAILAGDLLISEAYLLISQTNVDPALIRETQALQVQALFTVIGGELLDTEAAFKKIASAHPLIIAEQKTASYSFITPFLIGATLANAPTRQKELLHELGAHLGIAYQLRDDIIGVFGDEALSGKSSEGDLREGKRTLLIDEFYRQATDQQRHQFDALFGDPHMTSENVATIRTLLIESGARQSIEAMIQDYQEKTTQLVEHLSINALHKEALYNLIKLCLQREL